MAQLSASDLQALCASDVSIRQTLAAYPCLVTDHLTPGHRIPILEPRIVDWWLSCRDDDQLYLVTGSENDDCALYSNVFTAYQEVIKILMQGSSFRGDGKRKERAGPTVQLFPPIERAHELIALYRDQLLFHGTVTLRRIRVREPWRWTHDNLLLKVTSMYLNTSHSLDYILDNLEVSEDALATLSFGAYGVLHLEKQRTQYLWVRPDLHLPSFSLVRGSWVLIINYATVPRAEGVSVDPVNFLVRPSERALIEAIPLTEVNFFRLEVDDILREGRGMIWFRDEDEVESCYPENDEPTLPAAEYFGWDKS